jgi:ribosomal RNA assembly protein
MKDEDFDESDDEEKTEDVITETKENDKLVYSHELRIPKDRVAVVIGKGGEMKKQIEDETHSKLFIDSEEGEVRISGEDSIGIFTAKDIVKAIGRGFNPEIAMMILKSDYVFDILDLKGYSTKGKNMLRLKGRVIGKEGRSRKTIETLTETYVSVYGKTVGIIGSAEHVTVARKAIERLLQGSLHSAVYRWLEKKRRELKISEMMSTDSKYFKKPEKDEDIKDSVDKDEDDDSSDEDDEEDA